MDESKELMGAECDCPYDMGLICKHIVAALYSIRNNVEPEKKRTKLRNRVNDQIVEPEKQKAQLDLVIPKDSFKDLLAGLPKEELLNIIHELSLEDDFEYYIKLKKTHSEAEWSAIYPTILEQFEKFRRIYNCYLEILVEEKQYEKLLLYVKENPSQIMRYHKYLIKDYKSEAYNIFAYYATLMAEQASDRKGYYKVCNIIRQLIKLGGVEQGNMLVTKLKSKYPRRPAFIDELSKINTLVGK